MLIKKNPMLIGLKTDAHKNKSDAHRFWVHAPALLVTEIQVFKNYTQAR
jgi:hypothetical protein